MATPQRILVSLAFAIRDLLRDDDLVKAKPVEISITTELAMKMVKYFSNPSVFPGVRVSPEWERREDEEKKIAWDDEAGKRKLKKIRPDIIVHGMHNQDRNLLLVEAKRVKNTNFLDDIRKLKLMTLMESVDPKYRYGYLVGVHLVIDLPKRQIKRNDVYRNGTIDADLTQWLSAQIRVFEKAASPTTIK